MMLDSSGALRSMIIGFRLFAAGFLIRFVANWDPFGALFIVSIGLSMAAAFVARRNLPQDDLCRRILAAAILFNIGELIFTLLPLSHTVLCFSHWLALGCWMFFAGILSDRLSLIGFRGRSALSGAFFGWTIIILGYCVFVFIVEGALVDNQLVDYGFGVLLLISIRVYLALLSRLHSMEPKPLLS